MLIWYDSVMNAFLYIQNRNQGNESSADDRYQNKPFERHRQSQAKITKEGWKGIHAKSKRKFFFSAVNAG